MSSMHRQTSNGFTLIEVLIIAPIVILAISAFIAIIVSITGEVIVTRNATTQTYNTQDALDLIEQDVRLTTEFPVTTGSLPTPQGRNNNFTGTSAFTSSDNDTLVLTTAAADTFYKTNPLYYANQPNPCNVTPSGGQTYTEVNPNIIYNRLFTVSNMYFVKDNALWKRTYVPTYNTSTGSPNQNTLCTSSTRGPLQRNTCSPGYTATRCQTQDTKLVENVTDFSIKFFTTGDSTTDVGPGSAQTASTIEVSLTTQISPAGETTTNTMTRRMSKLNKVSPTASSSQWTYWPDSELQNNWKAYGGIWEKPGYIKTSGGVVFLKGLLRYGTKTNGTVVATLPPGYRPSDNINIPTSARSISGGTESAVIQVRTNGDIQIHYVNDEWVTLDGVAFLLDSLYPMTNVTLSPSAGWTTYIAGRELRYGVDGMGRTHIRGQIAQGTYTSGTSIASLPNSVLPTERFWLTAASTLPALYYEVRQSCPGICARGTSSTWMSPAGIFYPSTFTGWTPLTLKGGWSQDSGYPAVAYTKAADGVVSLKGQITGGSISSSTVLASLPAGYRPAARQIFTAVVSGTQYGRLDVEADGDILINGIPNNTWVTLNDIKFVAEQ